MDKTLRNSPLIPLLVLSFLSFAVRLWGIGDAPFWINEADNSRLLLYDTPRDRIAWTSSSAGLYLGDILIRDITLFFVPDGMIHNGESGLRIPSAFACSLSIPLVYKLASRFCENDMSWLVTISWAFNPFSIDWSQQVYTYGMWPIWCTFLLLATFRFSSSIKKKQIRLHDWAFFHLSMILAITSNLFILIIAVALFPHVVSTTILNYQENRDRLRIFLCTYGPHIIPGLISTYITLKPTLDPSVNDNSWMPSADWNAPLELMEILFPYPENWAIIFIGPLTIFGLLKNLKRIGNASPIFLFQKESSALFLAGTLQLFCFLFMQLLGSPSWATRYMLHLVPIWLVLVAMCISPKVGKANFPNRNKKLSFSNIGTLVMIILTISTIFSTGPATDMRWQDTRGAWELISEDYDDTEVQVVLTHPTEYFYTFYLQMFEMEPDLFVGGWDDFTEEELSEFLSIDPDSIHRIRLETHDDSNLEDSLAENYYLSRESYSKGMVVQHWVRLNG